MRCRLILVPIIAALAGCYFFSPASLMEGGIRYDFASSQPPILAAACIARNAEERPGSILHTNVRATDEAGALQVIANDPINYTTDLVAFVAPTSSGSAITLYVPGGDKRFVDEVAYHYVTKCGVGAPTPVASEPERPETRANMPARDR